MHIHSMGDIVDTVKFKVSISRAVAYPCGQYGRATSRDRGQNRVIVSFVFPFNLINT